MNVLLRLCGLVTGGEVLAVVRLSFVGVLEDTSESGSKLEEVSSLDSFTGKTGMCSSGIGWTMSTGFLIVVGEELGLSKRSGLSELDRKLCSKIFRLSSAVAGPVRGPVKYDPNPARLFAPTNFALANSSSMPCIS